MRSIQTRGVIGLGTILATSATAIAQPSSIRLTGVVHDFKASAEAGGHLDFETLQQFQDGVGPKIYCVNLVAPTLGDDGLPRLNGRWHSMESDVPEKLLDVDFVQPNIGYAIGAGGRLIKTVNGGQTWVTIPAVSAVELRAIDFVTESRGFIARADGRMLETADGGATWLAPNAAAIGGLWDVQCPVDDTVVFAIADGGRVMRRTLAGWVARASVPGKELRSVHFPVDNSRGCAVGLAGAIVTTTNGFAGNVTGWTIINAPANPAGANDLFGVHFLNNNLGYAVGANGMILKTTTGGASWTVLNSGVAVALRGVRAVSATTVFVVGDGGTTLVSRDAGATWTDAVSDATANLNAVCFPLGTVGYAVGDSGAIERFGAGHLITAPWTDSAGRPISPLLYDPSAGDLPGTYGNPYFERIHTEAGFAQWWIDTPGVNLSTVVDLVFERQLDGTYLFDSAIHEPYASKGGFFPIDGLLFGDYQATGHNFHFTFHLQATFAYDASAGQMLNFMGDDDVWVFFDGKQVVDVGGRHPARGQYVDLNRLDLVDGQPYTMDFFSAERQTTGSNILIRTNIEFIPTAPPTITPSGD
jgi:fibro-slime domain-containing protein